MDSAVFHAANTAINPLAPFLAQQSTVILDGGLATELEARGHDLSDDLWSARLLLEAPEAIQAIHADYLWAGADIIIAASYQATVAGFVARGMSAAAAADLIQRAVRLAQRARDEFWADERNRDGRLRPLVAASVGPYGAYLANGAEYTGDYDLDEAGLVAWHRGRWHLLAACQPDLLACETIPSMAEARALAALLPETKVPAWFSFSCQDGRHISDGTLLADCVRLLDPLPQVIAIGVNCTAPRFIPSLIAEAQRHTIKPIIVYPNSGEVYDGATRRWLGTAVAEEFGTASREWRKLGAAVIGGCCRTGPAHIVALSERLKRGRPFGGMEAEE